MNITGVKLARRGSDAVVWVEIGGTWVPVIEEPFDACFNHIVNESGLRNRYQQYGAERWEAFLKSRRQ